MTTFDELVEGVRTGWDRSRAWAAENYERLRYAGPWQIAAVVALALLAVVVLLPLAMAAVMVGLIAAFLVFWISEFVALMRLRDEAFPGRHDKLVWSVLMIVLPPVGAIAFGIYRRREWPAAGREKPASPWGDEEP
jgi:hypothetical protein